MTGVKKLKNNSKALATLKIISNEDFDFMFSLHL